MFAVVVIALLAPGQGSQTPGMLAPWLDDPDAEETLAAWSDAVGLDLHRLGTTADADEIKDTAVTQPLVVATALLAAARLAARSGLPATAPAAGPLRRRAGRRRRGRGALRRRGGGAGRGARPGDGAACALEPTGMSAVLGGKPDEVLARLDELGLDPANRNGAGQVVAAGPLPALDALAEHPPERARVIALPVAGAFHTRFMAPAEEALREHAAALTPADPSGRCCPTPTARSSPTAPRRCAGWSPRSPGPCAGTPAWRHCASSESPR